MDQQIQGTTPTFDPSQILQTTTEKGFEDIEPGFGAMAVMSTKGDTKYIWDKNNAADVEGARRTFDYFVKEKKHLAFKVKGKDGTKGEQVREFDPNEERYIFVPAMVGG
jgi:hypothetical protein